MVHINKTPLLITYLHVLAGAALHRSGALSPHDKVTQVNANLQHYARALTETCNHVHSTVHR